MNDIEVLEDILKDCEKVNLITLLRTFKKEGLENFIVIRKNKLENLLKRYKELEEKNKTQLEAFELGKKSARDRIEYDYISKSLIKEKIEGKIEELFEEMAECNNYDEEDNEEKRELTDMIILLKEVLEELLKEE